jgi:hypothetical protein
MKVLGKHKPHIKRYKGYFVCFMAEKGTVIGITPVEAYLKFKELAK